jgi:H+-transporting ATPase
VLLASGSAIPADCIVNHGNIEVDQAALTGESLPVKMHQGNLATIPDTLRNVQHHFLF